MNITPYGGRTGRSVFSYIPQIARAAYQGYQMYRNFTRARSSSSAPASRPSTGSRTNANLRGPGPVRRYRPSSPYVRRGKKRSFKRPKRVSSRGVKRRRSVTSGVYNKRRKTMRPFNKGRFTLSKFLMGGGSFPQTTFVRMKYRDVYIASFTAHPNSQAPRAYILNHIGRFQALPNTDHSGDKWMYYNTMKSFYEQYLVLGNRTVFTITRPSLVDTFAPINSSSAATSTVSNSFAGYWYIRVFYSRGSANSSDGQQFIGEPVLTGPNAAAHIDVWPDQRTFLSDPTVTFFKDKLNHRMSTGFRLPAAVGVTQAGVPTPAITAPVFAVDYESNNRRVRLSVNFSFKKHFMDTNPLKNGQYRAFDSLDTSPDQSFYAFVGYVSFNQNGETLSHVPVDRVANRQMTVDAQSYVSLRKPLITPTGDVEITEARMEEIREAIRQGLVEEDGLEVIHYAINRSPEDEPTPELERELQEEIENLLESEDSEAEGEDQRTSELEEDN